MTSIKSPFFFLFVVSLLVLNSCDFNKKNAELMLREEKLLEKEKAFSLKESEYQNLIKMRDSLLARKDSLQTFAIPEHILGRWSGKMICTESNCPENVIGDTRTDTWEFSENGSVISAKVTNKTGNARIYTGKYNGSEIHFKFISDSTATNKTEINIVLNDLQENKIKGFRDVIGQNSCVSRFSVDLDKSKK